MNKVINIPSERKFEVEQFTVEIDVTGDMFHTELFDLNTKDLTNVNNLDVGKKVYATSYDHKILVRRVA
jgi:hypothetical protein|tara:strand:+ start:147 stop:353 length:207 start_codon:yes stop_codon:yes gene_type:complete